MRHLLFSAVSTVFLSAAPLFAGALVEVSLDPLEHKEATLVVVGKDGTETSFTPAKLEELPTYSITTRTPWRDEPATFEGVRLRDVLASVGLSDAINVIVTAENDYSTVIESQLMQSVDILVATRVNGRAHTRRERGPIQFVLDMDSYESSDLTSESNYVWMAARIEPQG